MQLQVGFSLAAFGPPKEVLTPARIRETYGMEPQPEIQAS